MRFVPDAFRILTRSFSMWAFFLGLLALVLPDQVGARLEVQVDPYAIGNLALVLFGLGIFGRVIDQDRSAPALIWLIWAMLIGSAAYLIFVVGGAVNENRNMDRQLAPEPAKIEKVMSTPQPLPQSGWQGGEPTYAQTAEYLIPLVKKWEGKHPCKGNSALHCSYLDTIAEPDLWTMGYGHTKTAGPGITLTEAQATSLLHNDLVNYWRGVRKGFTAETIAQRLTPQRDAAFTDLGYNVGVGGIRKSTATKRLNTGNIPGACQALTWWNKAGGKVVRGLTRRRTEDQSLCLA